MAGTTFPRLLPLETVSRPGEALALVYPLAAGGMEVRMHGNQWEKIKQEGYRQRGTLLYNPLKGSLSNCGQTLREKLTDGSMSKQQRGS